MLHAAVAGRFFVSGPAIMVSASFRDVRARMEEYVETAGEGRELRKQTIPDYDHIHPLLVYQHEYEHLQLITSTPTGNLLAKLHQSQWGRLQYMMTKLQHKLGQRVPYEPPVRDWFVRFTAEHLNVDGLFSPRFESDPDWRHVRNIFVELLAYQHAEWALLESRFENPELDVSALQEALGSIEGFHMVPNSAPQLYVGDGDLVAVARRHGLTGESIIEAHAVEVEHNILMAAGADREIITDWVRRRVRADDETEPFNAAARVYDLLQALYEEEGVFLAPNELRLLLDLSMLAPLDPATWGEESLQLEAVHPALRFLRLLDIFHTHLAPLSLHGGLSVAKVDRTFAYLGWPTLTELASRSRTQEPFGPEIDRLADRAICETQ